MSQIELSFQMIQQFYTIGPEKCTYKSCTVLWKKKFYSIGPDMTRKGLKCIQDWMQQFRNLFRVSFRF